ncbi:MAG: glycosyltransferase family 2 protein [Ignavibacteria bacterium]|nr:glycosyltransferase family 2 protein [Ignavibacteria bacterium]
MEKLISVICPTYNEESYIESILSFFVNSKPENKELLIIDGGSSDRTKEIVQGWILKNNNIKLFINLNKIVPYALNLGIKESKGDFLIRIDAHTKYSDDYFIKILEVFERTGADIVGGPTRVAFETDFQKAVAVAITNPLGVGDSKVHNLEYNGYSDHVTFGAWKREIFDEVGLFDEELVRNQDDEFHYRAKSKGKNIYLSSAIKLWYYPRKEFPSLFKQYFQYGYYKPLVLTKVRSEIKLRHLIPSFFTFYILSVPIAFFYLVWIFPAIIYLLAISFAILKSDLNSYQKLISFLVYPAIHLGYGFGFILGMKKILKKNNEK